MLQLPYHFLAAVRRMWPSFEEELRGLESLRVAGVLDWPAHCQIPLEYVRARYIRSVALEMDLSHLDFEDTEKQAGVLEDAEMQNAVFQIMSAVHGELAIVLYSWRRRQTILRGRPYPYDKELTLSLMAWLEDVPYIAFERPLVLGSGAYMGAFVWANYNPSDGKQQLRLVLCADQAALSVSFSLIEEEDFQWKIHSLDSLMIDEEEADLLLANTIGFLQACNCTCAELVVRTQHGITYLELV